MVGTSYCPKEKETKEYLEILEKNKTERIKYCLRCPNMNC
jgi:hypothetical protein